MINKNRPFIIVELILVETWTSWPTAAQAKSNQCKNQCEEDDDCQYNASNSSSVQFISCTEYIIANNIAQDKVLYRLCGNF